MEEPVGGFAAKDLTAEKTKVLSAVHLPKDLAANTARGQYARAGRARTKWSATWKKKGIDPKSTTQGRTPPSASISTPAAGLALPFYLRVAAKRLGKRVTEIAVEFKRAPASAVPSRPPCSNSARTPS